MDRPSRCGGRGEWVETETGFMAVIDDLSLVESLSQRQAVDRWGIGTAYQYLKSIRDQSPAESLKGFGDESKWDKELADAASRLTYCDPFMEVKSFNDGSGITAGAIMEYDAVLSSRRKDRDGDVLETKGLLIDAKMPLLWQHLQLQPIGKHVTVLSQDDDLVVCKFAIADTALGRDAATLTRFGALRKSHGFKPLAGEVEPIEILKNAKGEILLNDKGQPIVRGWHVKKASVYEGSLVSIPSNVDGNVLRMYEKQFDGLATAYSRELLHDPLVKHWAKGIYDKRPVAVPGIDLVVKSGEKCVQWNPVESRWQDVETKRFVAARDANTEKKDMSTKEASMKCPSCGTANDMSGVPDGVDLSKRKCSSCGKPMAAEKAASDLDTKAGRTLSSANEERLRKAKEAIESILDDAGLNESDMEKALKKIAAGLAGDVVLSGGGKSHVETLAAKTVADLSVKSAWDDTYGDYLPGSYEAISDQLSRNAINYLLAKQKISTSDGYCRSLATFPTQAVICCRVSGVGKYLTMCFRIDYTVDADGKATFTGEPAEVEVRQTVVEKSAASTPDGMAAKSLTSLSRLVAAKIATADGSGGEVETALKMIDNARATLLANERGFDFLSLIGQ